MTQGRRRLPEAVRQFVERQATLPATEVCAADPGEQRSPYGSYWYRAVACMLLSGRVKPNADGYPNRTDVNRVCKEANFNQHLSERVARFLVAAEVLKPDREGRYGEGPNAATFWGHDPDQLQAITRPAVLRLVQDHAGYRVWRSTTAGHAQLVEFLVLFFACFKGLALPESQVGRVWHDFAALPREVLNALAEYRGIKLDLAPTSDWTYWLDERGGKALLAALYEAEWAWYAEHGKGGWVLASPLGLGLLGLGRTPPAPDLPVLFKALPNLSVFAGAGLALHKLVPLFRHCATQRIDQVFEFRLDPRRLARAPARDVTPATGCPASRPGFGAGCGRPRSAPPRRPAGLPP